MCLDIESMVKKNTRDSNRRRREKEKKNNKFFFKRYIQNINSFEHAWAHICWLHYSRVKCYQLSHFLITHLFFYCKIVRCRNCDIRMWTAVATKQNQKKKPNPKDHKQMVRSINCAIEMAQKRFWTCFCWYTYDIKVFQINLLVPHSLSFSIPLCLPKCVMERFFEDQGSSSNQNLRKEHHHSNVKLSIFHSTLLSRLVWAVQRIPFHMYVHYSIHMHFVQNDVTGNSIIASTFGGPQILLISSSHTEAHQFNE